MGKGSRRINEQNFPVFKKLIEEVFVKATGKKIEKVNEKICDDIADIIEESIGIAVIGGKSLNNYIKATLSNDFNQHKVNPEYPTLNNLAKFVAKKSELSDSGTGKEKLAGFDTWWINFEKENASLILMNNSSMGSAEFKTVDFETEVETNADFEEIVDEDTTNPELIDEIKKGDKKKFIFTGIRGGIYAGILASITIALVRYFNGENITPFPTGYENMSFARFMRDVFTPLLFFQIISGGLLGFFCSYNIVTRSKLSNNLLLFMLSFIVIVVLRQSMARDAWFWPGTYLNIDESGNVRKGGGILGEPDFETLATGFMGAFVISFLVRAFRKNQLSSFVKKDAFVLISKTIVCGLLAWCFTYAIYIILVKRLQLIDKGDFLIDPSIFIVDFPHPERPLFAMALYLIYVLSFLYSIRFHYYNSRKISH